jgi:hypothetical protein
MKGKTFGARNLKTKQLIQNKNILYEESCLLVYNAVYSDGSQPVFWRKMSQTALLATSIMLVSCSVYSFALKMEATCSSETLKHRFTFSVLHGIISQKIKLFITTVVRTSNPTYSVCVNI